MPDTRNSLIAGCYHAEELPNYPLVPTKSRVCFINRLPPEILSRIFELGTWSCDSNPINDKVVDARDFLRELEGSEEWHTNASSDSRLPFPALVSYVCRSWCDIALSTPSLWTSMGISPRAGISYCPELLTLERSGGLPIDICISCQLDDYEDDAQVPSDDDLRSLSFVLIPHVHRWRTMTIGMSEYHFMYEFLSAVSHASIAEASQLMTLELYYNKAMDETGRFHYPSMSKHFTLFGGSAPLLTTLCLWGVHVDWNQSWIASASNLKDLELAFHAEDVCPSWAQLATILRGASNLEKLTLCRSGPHGNPTEWFVELTHGSSADLNDPIQLPRLTSFTFAWYPPIRALGLLRRLRLPALKNLVLQFSDGNYTDLAHELARPVSSSSPPSAVEPPHSLLSRLESFKMAGLPCSIECVETIYGELQNIKSLKISLWSLPSLFLDTLGTRCTLPGRGGVWLPRLTTLYVSGASGPDLRNLVQKRRDAGVPLSTLYVEKWMEDDYELDDVGQLVKEVTWLMDNVETLKFFEGFEGNLD